MKSCYEASEILLWFLLLVFVLKAHLNDYVVPKVFPFMRKLFLFLSRCEIVSYKFLMFSREA